MSAGFAHTCGIKANGTVICWGDDQYGQTTFPSDTFSLPPVSSGFYHTCAVMKNGPMRCWGSNLFGQSSVPNTLHMPLLVK